MGSLYRSADDFGHKGALSGAVCRPVITELQRERSLQIGVCLCFYRVGAEIISERQVLLKRPASRWTNIKVMWNIVNGCSESLTLGNTEISLMDIA
jgi:hypothetical protein